MKIDSKEVGLAIHLTMKGLVDGYLSSKEKVTMNPPTTYQEHLLVHSHKEMMLRQWLCIETLLRATGGVLEDVCEGDTALQKGLEEVVSDCKGKKIEELLERGIL